MQKRYQPNSGDQAEPHDSDASAAQHRVRLLERLVRRYAWCRVPSFWPYAGYADYLLVIELLDGRRYWRCLASSMHTPDEVMLRWASCPPAKWMRQFQSKTKGTKLWHEFFDFWQKS